MQVLSHDDQAKQNGSNIMEREVIDSGLGFLAKLKTNFGEEILNEGLVTGQDRNWEGKALH
jgi:hypothetical protein